MLQSLKRYYARAARTSADDLLVEMCARARISPGGCLLDVGCGTGETTQRLADACQAGRLFGIEGDAAAAAAARQRGIRVVAADLERAMPLLDQRFDIIVLNQVVEHVRNLDLFVAEVARLLTRNGTLFVGTPNLASWTNIVALVLQQQAFSQSISSKQHLGNRFARAYRRPVPYDFPQHCHILTRQGVRDLLDVSGLDLVEVRGAGYFPVPGEWLSRLDPGHAQYLLVRARKRQGDA